jgi:hypothetical protein
MPARSSQASAASTSESASRPGGSASRTSIASPFSSATGPASPSTPTSVNSEPMPLQSMSSMADTRANRSASPGNEKERTTHGISGPSSRDSFAYFDPESSSLKTSQATFDSDSTRSLPTLPDWGWMSGGELYERPTSGRPISEHDSSSLLPTPTANLYEQENDVLLARREREKAKGRNGNGFGLTLANRVALLPTPSANDSTGAEGPTREARRGKRPTGGPSLRDLPYLLPTPMSSTYERHGDGGELRAALMHGPTRRLLPTPISRDWKGHGKRTLPSATQLLPTPMTEPSSHNGHARHLSGEFTNPPSAGGNTSPGPHPDQLMIEDG